MNKFIISLTLFVILLTTGCVSLKKSIYLQGHITKELDEVDQYYKPNKSEYLIKPNDNLYIKINSLDERTSAFLNNDGGNNTGASNISNPMAASLEGYRVELDGSIQFPFVGKIHVSGLSLDQVREKIQLSVSKYVEECSVNVKLLNDNITILGEVKSPGRFLLYAEEVNILEAISLAGDMTDFANKEKIRLIRKEGDVQQMLEINTLDERIIYSPYYYLKPGDIIYVEPRKLKSMALSNIPIGLSLTFLNTALLLVALFN